MVMTGSVVKLERKNFRANPGGNLFGHHPMTVLVPVSPAQVHAKVISRSIIRDGPKTMQEYLVLLRILFEYGRQGKHRDGLSFSERFQPVVRIEQCLDADAIHILLPDNRIWIDLNRIVQSDEKEFC